MPKKERVVENNNRVQQIQLLEQIHNYMLANVSGYNATAWDNPRDNNDVYIDYRSEKALTPLQRSRIVEKDLPIPPEINNFNPNI